MPIPLTATARLQFHAGFTLDDAVPLVPYFARLGISHLYASPILKARPGSTHGYDIVDHGHINPELGGEAALERLVAALRASGLGLILDIVPNHMGVGGADNAWWLDVLEWGRQSPYATFFDIDWEPPDRALHNRMLAPFLGAPYGEVLASGDLTLRFDAATGQFYAQYFEHRFPIAPQHYSLILRGAGDPALEDLAQEFGRIGLQLRDRAAARGLLFGAEVLAADLAADPAYAALVARECAILTPGLEAKWAATEPAEGDFRLAGLDAVAAFAQTHGIALHGHTLVWAVYNPPWLLDALREGRGEAVLARHVDAVCGRHAGQVLAWDVINEPVDPRWPADADGLCTTNWWHALGPAYMDRALRLAHAADPRALLLINDDDLEYDEPDRALKRTQYLRLAEALLRRGAPLHGFGLEAHLKPERRIAEREYRRFLAELAGMGLALFVTELDVHDRTLPADVAARDAIVADTTRRYLDLVLDEPAVRAVQCWGLSHRHEQMGRDPATRRADGLPNRALPFDAALEITPMGEAIGRALDGAPRR